MATDTDTIPLTTTPLRPVVVPVPRRADADLNQDPITGEPGAHPVGVGVGAASGAATGALIGGVAGPIGSAVGAIVRGVAGGLVGKGAAEQINPTTELDYWRAAYTGRPYAASGVFEDFEPAYRVAIDDYATTRQRAPFEVVEPRLRSVYESRAGRTVAWETARDASRDAWDRVAETTIPDRASCSKSESADLLNNVLRMLNDSVEGFASAAGRLTDPKYAGACRQHAVERETLAAELRPLIASAGAQPTTATELRGSLSRAWTSLTTALGGGDGAIINAIEAAEDHAIATYRETIASDGIAPETREVLSRQYALVAASHDQFSAWKHALADTK